MSILDKLIFDYGIIEYKHRFSSNRSLDDYEVFTLKKVISTNLRLFYKTMECDHLCYHLEILYRDDSYRIQFLSLDLNEWTFKIIHLGEMKFCI